MPRWTGVLRRYLRFGLLLGSVWIAYQFVTGIASCVRDPWKTYPMDTPPDITCRTGSVAGWTVWIWKCVDGERVVIGQHSAEMFWSAPQKETGLCGIPTPLEQRIGLPRETDCRRGSRWDNGPEQPPIVRRYTLAIGSDDSDGSDADERQRRAVSAAYAAVHAVVRRLGIYADVDSYNDGDLILEMEHGTTPAEVTAVEHELAGVPGLTYAGSGNRR